MYIHSYQSYLWNAATSQRCQRFGTQQVVQGDLVLQPVSAAAQGNSPPGNSAFSLPSVTFSCLVSEVLGLGFKP